MYSEVKESIIGQAIGGLFFGLLGGQLYLVVITSPPISIYMQVIQQISTSTHYDFFHMYAAIGIWCSVYLLLFAVFELAWVMKFAKRSLEELFGCFISSALTIKAITAAYSSFAAYDPACKELKINITDLNPANPLACERSAGLLFLVLMLGTVWTSLTLYSFRSTPYLSKRKREIVADYALPIAILLMALVANGIFGDIPSEWIIASPLRYFQSGPSPLRSRTLQCHIHLLPLFRI